MKRKILNALLSILIACGLWIYVITTVNPDDEVVLHDVPVVLSGETFLYERGLMLADRTTPTITLTLSGKRSDLKKVNKSNVTVVADLSRIPSSGKHALSYDIAFPGDVPDNAINVESRYPDRVSVITEGRSQKNIPIFVDFLGELPEGYIVDKEEQTLDATYITAIGPTAVLDTINHAKIEVDLTNRNSSFSETYTYTFCDIDGEPVADVSRIETKVTEVNLTMKIQRLKEVRLVVDVIYGGGASLSTTEVVLDPETIQVTGSDQLLESLDQLKLGSINLAELLKNTEITFPIELPEGVNNVTGVTEATVSISFKSLATKTLNITSVEGINIPIGMEGEILTKALNVTLRGSKEDIEELTEENVNVRVNFKDALPGTNTYKATIVVDAEFTSVGAVGSYSVVAKLLDPEEAAAAAAEKAKAAD